MLKEILCGKLSQVEQSIHDLVLLISEDSVDLDCFVMGDEISDGEEKAYMDARRDRKE